jgi:hypothetical protein
MTIRGRADLILRCGDRGIGVVAYGPVGYGVFGPSVPTLEVASRVLDPDDAEERQGAHESWEGRRTNIGV